MDHEISLTDEQIRRIERYAKSLGLTPDEAFVHAARAHLERCYLLTKRNASVVPIQGLIRGRRGTEK